VCCVPFGNSHRWQIKSFEGLLTRLNLIILLFLLWSLVGVNDKKFGFFMFHVHRIRYDLSCFYCVYMQWCLYKEFDLSHDALYLVSTRIVMHCYVSRSERL
jgi:hypothetical protein